MKEIVLKIEGMSCNHCTMAVKNALKEVAGVQDAEVSLDQKSARVQAEDQVQTESLISAVQEAGYQASV